MIIEVGQKMPDATLLMRLEDKSTVNVDLSSKLSGKKVAMVGVPGAFTGICSGEHLPGLIKAAPALRERGVDEIIVISVNDPAVMRAWGEATGATEAGITMLADSSSKLTEAMGLRFDAPAAGMIGRCIRFSALIDDGTLTQINVEESHGVCDLTSGDALIDAL